MKTVRIFIASSIVEFEQERDKLAARIRGLNDKYVHNDIYFQLDLCEDYSHAWAQGRKQEEFNELVRLCDFFFALVGADVGKATLEEIDMAREQFKKSGNALLPKIVVFFQDLSLKERSAEVISLREEIRDVMGQYPPKFNHVSEITRDILMELIDAGAFFDPASLEVGRKTHAELVARIDENRRKIAALGEATAENEAELLLLYRTNVELSRQALSEWETFYDYAWFLHKWNYDKKAIEIGTELEAVYTPDDDAGDRADLKKLVGDCYAALGRYEEAETYYRAALGLYWELAEAWSKLAETCVKLAGIMVKTYRYEAAERLYREALTHHLRRGCALEIGQTCHAMCGFLERERSEEADILKAAEEAFSDNAPDGMEAAQDSLTNWLEAFPCPDTAAKYMKAAEAEARKQTRGKFKYYKQTLANICYSRGYWLFKHNQMETAEILAYKSLEIRRKLKRDNGIAVSCDLLADILKRTNRPLEAERHYKETLDIGRRLAAQDPAQFELNLAIFCHNLAVFLKEIGRYGEAERYHKEALDIRRRRAEEDPARSEPALAYSCNNLASLLNKIRRYEEAERYCKEGLDIRRRLAAQDPARFEPNLADSCYNLAHLLMNIGHYEEAERYCKEGLDIRRRLAAQDPAQFEPDLAYSCHAYGVFLLEFKNKNDLIAALAYLNEAIVLYEKYPHLEKWLDLAIRQRSKCQQEIWAGSHGK